MSIELKIKLKSLAEEARIIRKEEQKCKETREYQKLNSIHLHRTQHIRPIARATHIAYTIVVTGLGYYQIEKNPKSDPDWKSVERMVKKYSDPVDLENNLNKLERWKKGDIEILSKVA